MADSPSFARALPRIARALPTSMADKCLAIAAVLVGYELILWRLLVHVQTHREVFDFIEHDVAATLRPVVLLQVAVYTAVAVGALIARKRDPDSPLVVHATLQSFMISHAFTSYALGPVTHPFGPTAFFGAVCISLLLFPLRDVLLAVTTYLVLLGGSIVAEQLGWIPYAPLVVSDPVVDHHLAPGRLFGAGVLLALMGSMQLSAFAYALHRMRKREEEIAGAYVELAQAHSALARLEKSVEAMPLGLTMTSPAGQVLYANPAQARMHGYEPSELVGHFSQVYEPGSEEGPRPVPKTGPVGEGKVEGVHVRKDGTRFPVQIVSDVVHDDRGRPTSIVTLCEDITERREMQEKLRVSEERYALAIRGTNEGVWDWNVEDHRLFLSPEAAALLGMEGGDLEGNWAEWRQRLHPEDREILERAFTDHLSGKTSHLAIDLRVLFPDDTYRRIRVRGGAVQSSDGGLRRVVGSVRDLTENELFDPLTGLPNRVLFEDRVAHALARLSQRVEGGVSALLVDFDDFNRVNASFGYGVGDDLLEQFAERVQGCVGAGDTVARFGGDEFAVLLEDLKGETEARALGEAIRETFERAFELDGREVFASATIGIAFAPAGAVVEPAEFLRNVETARHRAQAFGKSGAQVFVPAMRKASEARIRLESELRRAIDRNEFSIHYQPIVLTDGGRLMGFEALVRWRHPDRGLVSPVEFIPVAEETGLIVPIGSRVLREACRAMAEWQQRWPQDPPLEISVNLSAKQFHQRDLVAEIRQALVDTGLHAHSLKLEITESVVMEEGESSVAVLDRLKRLGVRLAIDDFGTGYSSLSYLHRFPVDTLKVDRSFVSRIGGDAHEVETDDEIVVEQRTTRPVSDGIEIVRTVVGLAHQFGMNVVAEGVETNEQRRQLISVGCDLMQGFLYAQPMHVEEVVGLLERESSWSAGAAGEPA